MHYKLIRTLINMGSSWEDYPLIVQTNIAHPSDCNKGPAQATPLLRAKSCQHIDIHGRYERGNG